MANYNPADPMAIAAALRGQQTAPQMLAMNTTGFRPSTNVEVVPPKSLGQSIFENTFEMTPSTFGKMLHHPLTPYRDLVGASPVQPSGTDATQFGLPDTTEALKNIKPWPSAPTQDYRFQIPQIPVTGL